MADRDIIPADNRLTRPRRQRSLTSQVSMTLLHPAAFFTSIPALDQTRQWLWIAAVILIVIGLSAVQRSSLMPAESTTFSPPVTDDFPTAPDTGFDPTGEFGGLPPDFDIPVRPTNGTATSATPTENLTTALLAASGMIVTWLVQTVLLAEVSLFNGYHPRFGRNFQIAIWASLPLALMAGLQLVYFGSTGTAPGQPGLAGLLLDAPALANWPAFLQAIALSLAAQLTIFWLWSLLLVYFGARFTLNGTRWASTLVILMWVIILALAPVLFELLLTGTVVPVVLPAEL